MKETDPEIVGDLQRALLITADKLRRKRGAMNARDRDVNIFVMEAAATEINRRNIRKRNYRAIGAALIIETVFLCYILLV